MSDEQLMDDRVVLVIEDNQWIREALASIMNALRIHFYMYESLTEAEAEIPNLEGRIGLVFSDFSLGDGKATSLLVACRQNGWLLEVPWLFHTGEPQELEAHLAKDLADAGLPAETWPILVKPAGISVIEAAIRQAMPR